MHTLHPSTSLKSCGHKYSFVVRLHSTQFPHNFITAFDLPGGRYKTWTLDSGLEASN